MYLTSPISSIVKVLNKVKKTCNRYSLEGNHDDLAMVITYSWEKVSRILFGGDLVKVCLVTL